MKQQSGYDRAAVILFTVTLVLFFSFFIYMAACERVSVFHSEQTHIYSTLTELDKSVQQDNTAPAGVRKVYQGVLDPELSQESCLCFNIAHHSIQVYFDEVLVYNLAGSAANRIGKNVSSNWCSVHVGQNHAGKTVRIVLTPLLEAAMEKEPEFLLGSHYAIAMDVLLGELPILILSALCILMGLFVVLVALYFRLVIKTGNNGIVYLGFFSVAIGLWKLTDLRSMPLLFTEYTMPLGYISVGALFLTALCLLMYFHTLFVNQRQGFLLLLSCGASLVCLYVLAMQLLGLTELRQNLVFSHVLLIISVLAVPLAAVVNRLLYKTWGILHSWRLLVILFMGIGLDLLFYYKYNRNGLMSFSILSLIIYMMIVFLRSVQDSTRKAYTDSRTGLENRNRWNELMYGDIPLPEPYAILVIDLNGLKHINDTLGHDAGDRVIHEMSGILRNTLPRNSVICRWGGDEFTILLTGISRDQLDQQIRKLLDTMQIHNTDNPDLPIYFAIGAVLSIEHAGISRAELFRLADEEMYRDKLCWYAQRKTTV